VLVIRIELGTPIQHALAPDVDVADDQDQEEDGDLDQPGPAERSHGHRPRIEERDFNVEQQEDHRNQVELHRLPLARIADRRHAALIRREFLWSGIAGAEKAGNDDRHDAKPDCDDR